MKLATGTRVALFVGPTALLVVLALTGALPPRHLMAVVGIALASIAAVGLFARAVKVRGRREAVPSLLWALAMLAVVVALGWDMRFTIVAAVLSVTGAFPGRKYKVAL